MKIPKKGDEFFTGFEQEFDPFGEILVITEVEGKIVDKRGREGRSITCSDGIGYDCFWSEKHWHFVYGLE